MNNDKMKPLAFRTGRRWTLIVMTGNGVIMHGPDWYCGHDNDAIHAAVAHGAGITYRTLGALMHDHPSAQRRSDLDT